MHTYVCMYACMHACMHEDEDEDNARASGDLFEPVRSLGLALGIVVLLAGVLLAHILSLTPSAQLTSAARNSFTSQPRIMPGAIFGLLWEMPGIGVLLSPSLKPACFHVCISFKEVGFWQWAGDILSHAVKYQVFHWYSPQSVVSPVCLHHQDPTGGKP